MKRILAPLFALCLLVSSIGARAGFVLDPFTAFPPASTSLAIVSTATYNNGDATSSSHNVTLPGSLVSGNLLIVMCGINNPPTITDPGGYTVTLSATSTDAWRIYTKISDGTETTMTLALSAARAVGCASYQVSGNRNGTTSSEIAISSASNANTANPDPPSLTPSWGSAANLWFAISFQADSNTAITTYPTSYDFSSCPGGTCGQLYGSNGTGSGGAGTGAVSSARLLTATSEDPGTFTFSNGKVRSAYTLAVRPQ